jgi:DNA-binding FadR family transcriptional regulator
MTDHPTTTDERLPIIEADSTERTALSRQRISGEMTQLVTLHEALYAALEATHPEAAQQIAQANRHAVNIEASAQSLAQQAIYNNSIARDLLTLAQQFAQERDTIVEAIRTGDTLEEAGGVGDHISTLIQDTEAWASEVEFDAAWRMLQYAGIASRGELIDWLFNGDDHAYDADQYEAMAEQTSDLMQYFLDKAAAGGD